MSSLVVIYNFGLFLLLLLRPPPVSLFNRGIKTTCCLALCDRSLLFPLRKSNLLRKVVMRSGLSWTGSGKKRLETVQGSETSHTCCWTLSCFLSLAGRFPNSTASVVYTCIKYFKIFLPLFCRRRSAGRLYSWSNSWWRRRQAHYSHTVHT